MIYLTNEDLTKCGLLDYEKIVLDVKRALIDHFEKKTFSKKIAIDLQYGHKFDSLISTNGDFSSCKWLGANTKNVEMGLQRSFPLIILNDKNTGMPLALMEASLISALRTGSYVALGLEKLAKEESEIVFIGSGVIAKATAAVVLSYPPAREKIKSIAIYSRKEENMKKFVKDVEENLNFKIKLVSNIDEALSKADVSVSLNNSSQIIVNMDNVRKDSTHIHLGGQDDDLDYIEYCAKNGKIICDDWEFIKKRNIQCLAFAYDKKKIHDRDIYAENLAELFLGTKNGREADEPIYFNAVGLPELDLYVASTLYKNAISSEKQIGLSFEISKNSHWILNSH